MQNMEDNDISIPVVPGLAGGQPVRCPNRGFCELRRSVLWSFGGGQFCFMVVIWCSAVWCGMMSCGVFRGDVRGGNVVGRQKSCYVVMLCHVMWWDAMGWNDMGWCPTESPCQSTCNPWDAYSNAQCHLGMQETRRLQRAHVTELRLGTTKNYCVLQCSTPVLLRYYKVRLSTTKYYYSILPSTTKYLSILQSITPYYKILRSITPYYQENITKNYSGLRTQVPQSTTRYYSALPSTTPYYSALSNTMELRHSCLIVPTHETWAPCGMQNTMGLRHSCLIVATTWSVIYIAQSTQWAAKHTGTTTFISDSRTTGNVIFIARSHL